MDEKVQEVRLEEMSLAQIPFRPPGQTPSDFGRYKADPEEELKRREAEEANEILELRSMGIRAMLSKKPAWKHRWTLVPISGYSLCKPGRTNVRIVQQEE